MRTSVAELRELFHDGAVRGFSSGLFVTGCAGRKPLGTEIDGSFLRGR